MSAKKKRGGEKKRGGSVSCMDDAHGPGGKGTEDTFYRWIEWLGFESRGDDAFVPGGGGVEKQREGPARHRSCMTWWSAFENDGKGAIGITGKKPRENSVEKEGDGTSVRCEKKKEAVPQRRSQKNGGVS